MKILIVDDNKQNLLLLEAMLKGGGHESASAGNGIEALEILGKEKVNMIISDILMPGMDGFKLCMKCKEDEKLRTIPFIFTTSSYTEAKDEEFGKSLGAEAFIVRPIEPEEFLKKIGEIFGKKKEKKEAAPVELRNKDVGFLEKYSERLASQLEHKIAALEKEITERKRMEEEREKLLHDLGERVKEMKCINEIARLAELSGMAIEKLAQAVVDLLPSAWQYPAITCARIILDSQELRTANFRETKWSQSADLKVDSRKYGAVTVCYLEEKPAANEGPFVKEERDLIETVADFLGHIIQHRRTEKEIRESEVKFRTIYDNATDGILLADLEAKKFFGGNKTICGMLGYSLDEVKSMGVMDIHPKEQLPYVIDQFEKQSRKEITLAKDIPVKRKDGSVFYADVNSSPITLGGKPYLMGIFRDITERRQTEEEQREHVQELEILAKAATGRELKMIDVEKEVNSLLKELGREPKYKA